MAVNDGRLGSGLIGSQAAFAGLGRQSSGLYGSGQIAQAQRARNAEISSWAERASAAWYPDSVLSKPLTLQEELQKETNEWLKGI